MKNRLPAYVGVFSVILLASVDVSLSANVLGIFSFPGASNFYFNKAILESLHAAGHRVTFLTTFGAEIKGSRNFTVVDISGGIPNSVGQFSPERFASFTVRERTQLLFNFEERYCAEIMKTQVIKDALSSKIKFDVLLTQLIFIPQCAIKVAEVLRIPVIGTVAFKQEMPILDSGNPLSPAAFPHALAKFDEKMSFFQRLMNTYYYIYAKFFDDTTIQPRVIKFSRQHFPQSPAPPKVPLSLVFLNSHSSLFPRPLVPNFIEIAGIHIRHAKPLNSTWKKFVDGAEHGVILFTFGSVVLPSQLPQIMTSTFVEAFASIPQRVIWKYDKPLENLSENVMIADWVPQRDILEHENVIAFISHCGQSGMLEAIVSGTPVLAMPISADQPSNAQFLQNAGAGLTLSPFSVTKTQIVDALNEIVNDTRYSENMHKLSERFLDRPWTPAESVVYWTEYVIRHQGAIHLRPLAADIPIYQYLLVDVILFVCGVATIIFYVLYFIIVSVGKLKLSQSSSETHRKKE